MTPEQEKKYEGLVRLISLQSQSAREASNAMLELEHRIEQYRIAIVNAHLDIEKSEGKIVSYGEGYGPTGQSS